jgi:predicted secreted protein
MKKERMIAQVAAVVLLAAAGSAPGRADGPPTYDRVTLSVSATRDVANDTLIAIMYAQREGASAADLATEVNATVAQAVEAAEQTQGIKVQTLDYQTHPVHNKDQTFVAWRVRQALQLASQDPRTLARLIAQLQRSLALQSMSYAVSPPLRASVEDALIAEAVEAFGRRADLVARRLARPGYRIVALDVETTPGPMPRPVAYAGRAMLAEAAAPALEAGTQEVSVTIRGTVELSTRTPRP